jgi:hypothetical protein
MPLSAAVEGYLHAQVIGEGIEESTSWLGHGIAESVVYLYCIHPSWVGHGGNALVVILDQKVDRRFDIDVIHSA